MADTIEQALTNARNICKNSRVIPTILLSANRLRKWNVTLTYGTRGGSYPTAAENAPQ